VVHTYIVFPCVVMMILGGIVSGILHTFDYETYALWKVAAHEQFTLCVAIVRDLVRDYNDAYRVSP
jgi:hypothetical protein